MKEVTSIEIDENDFNKIERWLIHEVTEDGKNYEVCRDKAFQQLRAMLTDAFNRGRHFQRKMQSCVD